MLSKEMFERVLDHVSRAGLDRGRDKPLKAWGRDRLGIDHNKLTFKYQGLDQRLTGVEEAHVQSS